MHLEYYLIKNKSLWRILTEINFKCKKCNKIFNCDIGKIDINKKTMRSIFEKEIICPICGIREIDDVLLTELGQSQITEATLDL